MKTFSIETGVRRRRWPMVVLIISVVTVVFAITGFVLVDRWYAQNIAALDVENTELQTFIVEPGESATSIGENLESAELIKSSRAFSWYVGRNGVRSALQAGTYQLSPSLGVEEIVSVIANGEVATQLVTVISANRLDEISDRLVERGFAQSEVEAALALEYDHPLLAQKPAEASLEGYIYPETYQIVATSTAEDVLRKSFDVFYNKITDEMLAAFAAKNMSLHEAIILASIIQQESNDPLIQPQIAEVFLNRLEIGQPLGADPTFRYASAIAGVEDTIAIDSPYNTRIYAGLPPGPIGNFGIGALEAIAVAEEHDYFYFVAGDDGNTYFTRTLAEHEAATAEHCIELCKL